MQAGKINWREEKTAVLSTRSWENHLDAEALVIQPETGM